MLKIKNIKAKTDLYELTLENDDVIIMTSKEYEQDIYENEFLEFESVGKKRYVAELSEIECSDEIPEIIGFSLVS